MADQISKWDDEIDELIRKKNKDKTDSGNDLQRQINELNELRSNNKFLIWSIFRLNISNFRKQEPWHGQGLQKLKQVLKEARQNSSGSI
jgi:hypothetical protein